MRRTGKTVIQAEMRAAALVAGLAILQVAAPSQAGEQNRVAFVTSAIGTGDLSSWAEADGGTVGAEAGDSICRNLAAAALLENPENFVAWISTETDDAYCRLHNLSGKKTANCGQVELPESAGPWIRTDGTVWAPAIEELTSGDYFLYTPLDRDENGSMILTDTVIFTATDREGTLKKSTTTCEDWTSSSSNPVGIGFTTRTIWSWAGGGTGGCQTQNRLACIESGAGPALPEIPPPTRPTFITSADDTGDLSSWSQADPGTEGIAAGDSVCRNLAEAAGLEGASHYRAWLSDGLTNAIDRFEVDAPWQRLDGVPIAAGKADLTDGTLFSTITLTEQGGVIGNATAWTGTDANGLANGGDCQDWSSSSASDMARTGSTNSVAGTWTSQSNVLCDFRSARLYCLADRPFSIFTDGFESGDTSAWSSTQ